MSAAVPQTVPQGAPSAQADAAGAGADRRAPRVAVAPTRAGRVVLLLSATAVPLAWSGLGVGFAWLGAAGLASWCVSAMLAWRNLRALRVTGPGPGLATAREPFASWVTVACEGVRAAYDVSVSLRGVHGERTPQSVLIPRLGAGPPCFVSVPAPPLRRGRHPLGVVTLRSEFPTGLVAATASFRLDDEVVVVPRPGTVRDAGAPSRDERRFVVAGAARRGEDQEMYGVRAWREGEGLRGVHWKLTARTGRRMVREFRGEPRPAVHVALDPRVPAGLRDAHGLFEDAVSLSASLVEHSLRRECPVRLSIAGAEPVTVTCDRAHGGLVAALIALADARPARATQACAAVPARAGERRWLVRAGDAGGASVLPGARIVDVALPESAEVFTRSRRSSGRAAGNGFDARPDAGADAFGAGIRRTAIVACALAGVVTAAAVLDALTPGEPGFSRSHVVASIPRFTLFAAAIVQVVAVLRTRDPGRALRATWTSPLLALGAVAQSPSWLRAAGLLTSLGTLLFALALHAAREARRASPPAPGATPDDRAVSARVRTALGMLLPVALLAAILLPVTMWTPGPSAPPHGSRRSRTEQRSGDVVRVDPAGTTGNPALLERAVLVRLTPRRGGKSTGNLGPLYLRGFPFTEVRDDGSWGEPAAAPPLARDADDGRADGWTRLTSRPPAADDIEFETTQTPLPHAVTGLAILHVPVESREIGLPSVRRAKDGVILRPGRPGGEDTFRVRAPDAARVQLPTAATRALPPDGSYLSFPSDCPVADVLAEEAGRVAEGAASDLGKVRAIVRHLRTAYAYRGTGAGLDEAGALEALVGQKAGTCVQFAEAAALMLRSLGVPTRVATGFLITEWDERNERYLGRGRDYHAWVEVPFEGCGWVVFEPTPAASGDSDRVSLDPEDDEVLGSKRLGELLRSAGIPSGAAAAGWLVSIVVVAAALSALARWRARREAARPPDARSHVLPGPWERLLGALSRRGHVRRRAQTATEFAAQVAEAEGPSVGVFRELTARQQAARFGGHPLTGEDLGRMDDLRREL